MITKNIVLNVMLLAALIFTVGCSCERNVDHEDDSAISEAAETTTNEATSAVSEATGAAAAATSEVEAVDGEGADIENTYTDQYGNIVYTIVEQKPSFSGGEDALYKFLKSNLNYPEAAIDQKAEGTVHVAFVVSKDGTIRDVELAKGLDESSLNEEAMRVVSEMPNWTPGMQQGENVDVKFTLPVTFNLN